MITVLQILFVLSLITLLIILVFKPRRMALYAMPEGYQDILQDYVVFYSRLENAGADAIELNFYAVISDPAIAADQVDTEMLETVGLTYAEYARLLECAA